MPMQGYLVIDDRLVAVENIAAEITITDPDEVAVYSTLTDGCGRPPSKAMTPALFWPESPRTSPPRRSRP